MYSFYRLWKDERLSRPWSHTSFYIRRLLVLSSNTLPLTWALSRKLIYRDISTKIKTIYNILIDFINCIDQFFFFQFITLEIEECYLLGDIPKNLLFKLNEIFGDQTGKTSHKEMPSLVNTRVTNKNCWKSSDSIIMYWQIFS